MSVRTIVNTELDDRLMNRYFTHLVNAFYKILPMREMNEESLETYLESLRIELLGCNKLIQELEFDPAFLRLLSIIQYFIDTPDCDVRIIRREVFKAISLCKEIQGQYPYMEGGDPH